MKVLLAGCAVFGALLLTVVLLGPAIESLPRAVAGPAIAVLFLGFIIAAFFLFNRRRPSLLGLQSSADTLAELKGRGQVVSTEFRAQRAFQVAEYEDEGPHYFLELTNGAVLYLTGQYLYDFEPIEDDPELNQPRRFPCTHFVIHRHSTEHYVVELQCLGPALDPECSCPPFSRRAYRSGQIPEDGAVISDRSYDQLKATCSTGV